MNKHIADLCEYRLVKTGWNQNGFDQVSWFDYTLLKLTSIATLNKRTRSMYWRRASIQDVKRTQAPGDATVRKRFFRDNLVIFRRRSKRIAFLESVNFSMCVCMQIFNFRDGHVITFRHRSEAYICQMPGHWLSRLAKGTPSESRLSIGTLV